MKSTVLIKREAVISSKKSRLTTDERIAHWWILRNSGMKKGFGRKVGVSTAIREVVFPRACAGYVLSETGELNNALFEYVSRTIALIKLGRC